MNRHWDTTRTEAFSDGVFAIAITLLVLDITIPESELGHLWHGIAHQWPDYLAYLTSFMTIGAVWLAHHGIFRRLHSIDTHLMRLNLVLLLAVVPAIPHPADGRGDTHHQLRARGRHLLRQRARRVISVLLAVMWRAVAARPQLLEPGVSDTELNALVRASAPNVGGYIIGMLLALVAPQVAAFGYLLNAFVIVGRVRAPDTPDAKTSARGSA